MKEREPHITVMGIGDAGCFLMRRLYFGQTKRWELIGVHTSEKVLAEIDADQKFLIGKELTGGAGTANRPHIGEKAARLKARAIKQKLENTDLLVVLTGFGGGTGTGATPVIAEIAHELSIYTIAVIIKPFEFQGEEQMNYARTGFRKITKIVDKMLVIDSDEEARHLERVSSPEELFKRLNAMLAERVLHLLTRLSEVIHFVEVEEEIPRLDRRMLREMCDEFYHDRHLAFLTMHEWR